jgi:ElaB/YqjD/DUF883 family membrane-anchored ribosome-binding protein
MARRKVSTKNRVAPSIEDELNTIAADVVSLGNTIGDVASAETREMLQSIRQRLDTIAEESRIATRMRMEMVEDAIRNKPVVSVLTAFALGFGAATILRR